MKQIVTILLVIIISASLKSQTAPDFLVTDAEGDQHHLYSILSDSNYVLIDFFFVDCSFCQYYAPHINQTYLNFGSNQHDVFVIGIDFNDDSAEVVQFAHDYNLDYPLVSGLDGGGDSVIADYGIQAFPTVMIVGPDSNIWKIINTPTTEITDSMLIKVGADKPTNIAEDIEQEHIDLKVWPNPVESNLNIQWSKGETADIYIYNISGKMEFQANITNQKSKAIDVGFLSSGIYLLKIDYGQQSARQFFIKQ